MERTRKFQTERERGTVEKELMNWTSGKRDDGGNKGGKKGTKVANLGTVTETKDPMEAKGTAKVKVRTKPDLATTAKRKGTLE